MRGRSRFFPGVKEIAVGGIFALGVASCGGETSQHSMPPSPSPTAVSETHYPDDVGPEIASVIPLDHDCPDLLSLTVDEQLRVLRKKLFLPSETAMALLNPDLVAAIVHIPDLEQVVVFASTGCPGFASFPLMAFDVTDGFLDHGSLYTFQGVKSLPSEDGRAQYAEYFFQNSAGVLATVTLAQQVGPGGIATLVIPQDGITDITAYVLDSLAKIEINRASLQAFDPVQMARQARERRNTAGPKFHPNRYS